MVRVLLHHENEDRNKHVESVWFPCLDEGSTPSSSTLMKGNKIFLLAAAMMTSVTASAQIDKQPWDKFNHLNVGVTLGTTGLGVEASMPINNYLWVRSGLSFMPRMEVPMTFEIQVGDDPATSKEKFNKMSSALESFTGKPVSDNVYMTGKAKMWNWNVLFDIYPFQQNLHWRVTAGFFLGPSNVAEAFNQTESMASLVAVDIYNNVYDKLHGKSKRELAGVKLIDLGPGYEDVYLDLNMLLRMQEMFDNAGRMGLYLGDYSHDITDEDGNVIHKKGDPYVMTPNDEHMVKADMKVNAFKPYIGFGYDGRLVKGNDRLHVGFDAGIMLWGGKPCLYAHDGTDLINDVENITGKVGDYVDMMSKLVVYPVANVRFTYTIF